MLGLINSRKRTATKAAHRIYDAIMDVSRQPVFFGECRIPDTLEGRFEVLTLHAGLVVNRLSKADMGREGTLLAQCLFDVMFKNLDWSLREMGVGDLAVPRRIKALMSAFKGRSFAYDEAVRSGRGEIKHALIRNLYGTVKDSHNDELEQMTTYLQHCVDTLNRQGLSDFYLGKLSFPDFYDCNRRRYDQQAA